jgi:hypothetical protein
MLPKVTSSLINETIESAKGSIYEVSNIVDQLIENEVCLAEDSETLMNFVKYLNGLKKDLNAALTKYDDLAA